ncbi:zf-HC2 domain-containing protein [Streptosporangium fragile]|uniref:Zf-HC2 domain-containing protein n=1 Tax=Streptosporangium fragile TaxID=46186 RepID=A0ABN3W2L9_9ACTN
MRMSLGVYALGALDPEERVLVEAHLAECAGCRAEAEELNGVAAFLGRVSEDDVAQVASPPTAVLDRLLSAKARRRRRVTRLMLSLAASVALLGLGGGVVWTVATQSRQDTASTAAAPESAAGQGDREGDAALGTEAAPSRLPDSSRAAKEPGGDAPLILEAPPVRVEGRDDTGTVRATVTAFPGQGATTVKVVLSGVAKGTRCRLDVIGAGGFRETAGNWIVDRAAYDRSGAFTGTTTIPPEGITSFEITTAAGRVLLTVPVR